MNPADFASLLALRHPDKLFIGGQWVAPAKGGAFDMVSPMTEEAYLRIAEATEPDMDRAADAAREAFDNGPWPKLSHAERADYLRRIAAGLAARAEALGHAWTQQVGILHAMGQFSAHGAAGIFNQYADIAGTFAFEEQHTPGYGGGTALIVREPVGVVAAIVPWNGPLSLASLKVAPALLAGCTVVLKASPEAPLDAYVIAEIAEEIGLPAGVLNLVTADRPASEHLVRNPTIDKVSFTGSSVAGRKIASICGERMARFTMELGGKSAAIVLDDMPVEEAVQGLTGSICLMSGQVCAALTRVVVPRRRHDEFADGFAAAMSALKAGNPYDPASNLGPLAMGRQLDRVLGYIEKGKAEGARLAAGGGRPAGLNRGFYVEPTLFVGVDNAMTIAQEEIFGPVISLIPVEDEEDAVRIANESIYGLNGAVLTHDRDRAYAFARRMRTGNVSQNQFRVDTSVTFGGYKQSGVGREGGVEGLLPYLEAKTVFLDDAA
ncbi:aldehyde dehydrogenase [Flavisphingomonas formosensis]|uniref:aldehyde dehydrogenase n=1 Tax=Flavisphingomonas formosensis TaxID=861534 RepID=UPI0012FAB687|nr:aldehyde dehydrogenase [Sphingomonas formosensis]